MPSDGRAPAQSAGARYSVSKESGCAGHAAGAVQRQDNIGGIGQNIGGGRQRQRYAERAIAGDTVRTDYFV